MTFVGSSSFKTPMPPNVTEGGGFIPYIKTFKVRVFSSDQVSTMIARLESVRLASSFASHREHVRNLRTREDPTAQRLCPRCGGALVLRTAKRGSSKGEQFWGCSNYPGCKTVQKLS